MVWGINFDFWKNFCLKIAQEVYNRKRKHDFISNSVLNFIYQSLKRMVLFQCMTKFTTNKKRKRENKSNTSTLKKKGKKNKKKIKRMVLKA